MTGIEPRNDQRPDTYMVQANFGLMRASYIGSWFCLLVLLALTSFTPAESGLTKWMFLAGVLALVFQQYGSSSANASGNGRIMQKIDEKQ